MNKKIIFKKYIDRRTILPYRKMLQKFPEVYLGPYLTISLSLSEVHYW